MAKTITIKVCSKGCIVASSEAAGNPYPQPHMTANQVEEPFSSDADALKYVTDLITAERT